MVRRGKNVDHSNIPSITSDACSKSVETADSLQQVLQSRVVPTHNHYFVMMSSFQYLNFTFIWRIILFRFSTFCIKIFVQLGPRKSVQSDAVVLVLGSTLGFIKNETLVFINFSAQGASILKISVPIIKRRSWGFQNTPNLQNLHDFKPSYGTSKKTMFWLPFSKSSIKIILENFYFL